MSGNLAALWRLDFEHISTGKPANSMTTHAASEAEARRKADEIIRRSPTPNDLRATVTHLAATLPAEATSPGTPRWSGPTTTTS
jgi:hypothetical protein